MAAPTTTIDLSLASGDEIPIEQRNPTEVTHIQGVSLAPENTEAANPAFDVTPAKLITAIITEHGVIESPTKTKIRKVLGRPGKGKDKD